MNETQNPVRIGRYEVVTMLGQGGMARVYLALARGPVGFNKLVVVKQIRPELAWDEEFLTMFLEEARIAARLNHPNVVSTLEVLEEDGQYAIAMEFLEGQTLADLLRRMGRGKMPIEEHLWILTQVLAGLHYGHELRDFDGTHIGVVHRDVSPSNVFLTYNGEVKLLDFGIAKATGAVSVTNKGTVKGKLGYGAPEQFLSNPVDARTDVFSVGVMMWEALAGQRRKPAAETAAGIFQARVAGWEPTIAEVRPDVPPMLGDICNRSTAVNPEARYPCAADLQHDLERYLETCARRVGRRELGELVSYYFEAERAEIRRRIEGTLGGVAPASSVTPGATMEAYVAQPSTRRQKTPLVSEQNKLFIGAALLGAAAVMGVMMVRAAARKADVSDSAEPAVVVVPPAIPQAVARTGGGGASPSPSPVGSGKTALPAGQRMAAAVLGAAAASEAAAARPRGGAEAPPAAAAPGGGGGAAAARPGAAAQLVVRAVPRDAVVTLDGVRLTTNPYHAAVPRDGREHVLRASAAGYETQEHRVVFTQDMELTVTLDKASSGGGSGKRALAERPLPSSSGGGALVRAADDRDRDRDDRGARPAGGGSTRSAPTRAASLSPPPVPGGALPPLEPGVDLQRTIRGPIKRQIDEKDPYGQ
jgi:eukaryotic-like serine/threonine-protein kinase